MPPLPQRSHMWGDRKRERDNTRHPKRTQKPWRSISSIILASLGWLGDKKGKCSIFDKWVMLCLHPPQKTRDGDGGEQPREGRSLLVECISSAWPLNTVAFWPHAMTQHHFYSPWQPWASLFPSASCSTVRIWAEAQCRLVQWNTNCGENNSTGRQGQFQHSPSLHPSLHTSPPHPATNLTSSCFILLGK